MCAWTVWRVNEKVACCDQACKSTIYSMSLNINCYLANECICICICVSIYIRHSLFTFAVVNRWMLIVVAVAKKKRIIIANQLNKFGLNRIKYNAINMIENTYYALPNRNHRKRDKFELMFDVHYLTQVLQCIYDAHQRSNHWSMNEWMHSFTAPNILYCLSVRFTKIDSHHCTVTHFIYFPLSTVSNAFVLKNFFSKQNDFFFTVHFWSIK